jgi:hypothetical protein
MAELNENNLRSIVASFKAVEERMSDPLVTADNKRLTELSHASARALPKPLSFQRPGSHSKRRLPSATAAGRTKKTPR